MIADRRGLPQPGKRKKNSIVRVGFASEVRAPPAAMPAACNAWWQ